MKEYYCITRLRKYFTSHIYKFGNADKTLYSVSLLLFLKLTARQQLGRVVYSFGIAL